MEMLSSFGSDKHEFCLVVIKFKYDSNTCISKILNILFLQLEILKYIIPMPIAMYFNDELNVHVPEIKPEQLYVSHTLFKYIKFVDC